MELTTLEPGALLLDASTVEFLSGHVIYCALTGPYWADERVADLLRDILARQAGQKGVADSEASDLYALTHALSFLEQWMLAEKCLVDRSALISLADHNRSDTRTEQLRALGALYTGGRHSLSRQQRGGKTCNLVRRFNERDQKDFWWPGFRQSAAKG